MPSTVTYNRITVPNMDKESLRSIPEWAHTKYRKSEEINIQLTTNIIKLEKGIADLDTMLQKDECPRSLQVKIEVSVKQPQQAAMDQALFEAKKIFHKSVLQALITARKSELTEMKSQQSKLCDDFIQFLKDSLETIARHNIPLSQDDSDAAATVDYAKHLYEEQAQKIAIAVKTQFLFKTLAEQNRKQIKEAEAEERRMNMQLRDPEIKSLQERLDKLESTLKKPIKSNQKNTRPSTDKKPSTAKSANRSSPFPQGRQPNKKKKAPTQRTSKSNQKRGKPRQGQGPGNQKPQRRYTNTTNRSASLPPNSRKRQN